MENGMTGKNLALIENLAKKALDQVAELKAMLTEITPSGIKYLKNEGYCPERYHTYFVAKTEPVPITENELKRRFLLFHMFDQLPGGCTEEPRLQRLKNGKPSTEELRLLDHARKFKEECQDYGIKVIETNYPISYMMSNQYIRLTDHIDALVEFNGEPAILRVEVTSRLKNPFKPLNSDYGWGAFHLRDHMMAYLMMIACDETLGNDHRFIYWVADYKATSLEHDVMEVKRSGLNRAEAKQAIESAFQIVDGYRKQNWQPVGEYEHCRFCPKHHCDVRANVKPIKEVHTGINYYTK